MVKWVKALQYIVHEVTNSYWFVACSRCCLLAVQNFLSMLHVLTPWVTRVVAVTCLVTVGYGVTVFLRLSARINFLLACMNRLARLVFPLWSAAWKALTMGGCKNLGPLMPLRLKPFFRSAR